VERFIKGDVVAVPFPFSDLSEFKRRFALVVAEITGDDVILCQITSQLFSDEYSISIDNQDFTGGSILHPSDIRRKNYLL
jgi:mRNA interferase MazF